MIVYDIFIYVCMFGCISLVIVYDKLKSKSKRIWKYVYNYGYKYYFIKKNCFGNELSMMNYLRIIVIYFWGYVIIYVVVLKVDGFFVFFKCS